MHNCKNSKIKIIKLLILQSNDPCIRYYCSGVIGTVVSKMLQKKPEDTSRLVTTMCLK